MTLLDKMLYALFILAAVTLACLGFCAFDWVWAAFTVGIVLLWAAVLYRRCHSDVTDADE